MANRPVLAIRLVGRVFGKVKKRGVFVEVLTQISPAGADSGNHQYPVGMTTEVRHFNPSGGRKNHPFQHTTEELKTGRNFCSHRCQKSLFQVSYLQLLTAKMVSVITSSKSRIINKVKLPLCLWRRKREWLWNRRTSLPLTVIDFGDVQPIA
jgi:hypothetical protein